MRRGLVGLVLLATIASGAAPVPRNRVTQSLEDGSLDITPRAREWEADPDRFVFSSPVIEVGNAVFSPAGRPLVFHRAADLKGHSVVTRLGYAYPELDALFADQALIRQDAPDEAAMLRMVHAGRVDAAFLDEAVGRSLMPSLGFAAGDFAIARGDLPSVGYRFMFAPRWAPLIVPFNHELEKLEASEELDKIVARYLRR